MVSVSVSATLSTCECGDGLLRLIVSGLRRLSTRLVLAQLLRLKRLGSCKGGAELLRLKNLQELLRLLLQMTTILAREKRGGHRPGRTQCF